MQYHEAIALINQDPDALYYGCIDGHWITLPGRVMRGYLVGCDNIQIFKRF